MWRWIWLGLLLPATASAHSRLVEPPSRSEDDFLMEGPCGGVAPGEPTQYTAGEVVEMRWVASQNHFNVYRVAFSPADDEGFDDGVLGTRPDEEDVFEYVQSVPLPACTCDDCTLQLAQFTATGKLAYYSCADIEIVAPDGEDTPPCLLEDAQGSTTTSGGPLGSSSSTGEGTSTSTSTSNTGDSSSEGDEAEAASSSSGATAVNGAQSCRSAGPDAPAWILLLALVALPLRPRRGP